MKIGVVSDTHSRVIAKQLLNDFKSVDLIVHAGDFCSEKDLRIFTQIKEVKAVYGNMDEPSLVSKLTRRLIFQWGGFFFGLCHGQGAANHALANIQSEFKKDKLDVVIFGHSHCPFNQEINGILYFNPGSPNDFVCSPYCSYG